MRSKFIILTAISFGVITIASIALFGPKSPEPVTHINQSGKSHALTVYKSATCGCCAIWTEYMKSKGYRVDVVDTEDLNDIKEKYKVPESLYSCHTTVVNDGQYFIEGHIPEEAIAKLFEDEPAIAGIGMPGMPAASPGMPGTKLAPFEISKVEKNGTTSQFMSI